MRTSAFPDICSNCNQEKTPEQAMATNRVGATVKVRQAPGPVRPKWRTVNALVAPEVATALDMWFEGQPEPNLSIPKLSGSAPITVRG
jgi:hypothetical protein